MSDDKNAVSLAIGVDAEGWIKMTWELKDEGNFAIGLSPKNARDVAELLLGASRQSEEATQP